MPDAAVPTSQSIFQPIANATQIVGHRVKAACPDDLPECASRSWRQDVPPKRHLRTVTPVTTPSNKTERALRVVGLPVIPSAAKGIREPRRIGARAASRIRLAQ